jgi:hypothetical protein
MSTYAETIDALLLRAEMLRLESLQLRQGGFLLWMPPRKAAHLQRLTAEMKEINAEIIRLRLEDLRA